MALLGLVFALLVPQAYGFDYGGVDYSFDAPKHIGGGYPQASGCCPHAMLAANYSGDMMTPVFLGIGAQKSGTTFLAYKLAKHPELHMPPAKEMHFLDLDVKERSQWKTYLQMWKINHYPDWIRKHKEVPKKHKLFEVSPSYMYIPMAACRAKRHFPKGKFIVVLRDPAERAFSEYTHIRNICWGKSGLWCPWPHVPFANIAKTGIAQLRTANCQFNEGPLNKTWNDCYKCLMLGPKEVKPYCKGRGYFFKNGPHQEDYQCSFLETEIVARGLYAAQIAWWFEFFKPEQFIFINSRDLFGDPTGTVNRVLSFLGVRRKMTKEMVGPIASSNKGRYRFTDDSVETGKAVLREFYRRPNIELYKFLKKNGHHFEPFEDDLEEVQKTINEVRKLDEGRRNGIDPTAPSPPDEPESLKADDSADSNTQSSPSPSPPPAETDTAASDSTQKESDNASGEAHSPPPQSTTKKDDGVKVRFLAEKDDSPDSDPNNEQEGGRTLKLPVSGVGSSMQIALVISLIVLTVWSIKTYRGSGFGSGSARQDMPSHRS